MAAPWEALLRLQAAEDATPGGDFLGGQTSSIHIAWVTSGERGKPMTVEISELDQMQAAYKAAVEQWIAAIREEEALASANHSEAEIDTWEAAGFREEEARDKAKEAKQQYEDALREKFFNF
jgi:hypothetical protein